MFFSFDGLDGVGKTTQLELFCNWLTAQGRQVVRCQDPGSTPLGEELRTLLLDRRDLHIDRTAEMLMFMAARAQLVAELIRPALEQQKVVVSDRYLLANVVYQGYARGLNIDALWQIGHVATGGLSASLTFVLDMTIEAARSRMQRGLDRMELEAGDFQRRLRAGFLAEAAKRPQEIAIIDASRSIDEVQQQIRQLATPLLESAVSKT